MQQTNMTALDPLTTPPIPAGLGWGDNLTFNGSNTTEPPPEMMPLAFMIPAAVGLTIVNIITILGNTLVVATIYTTRRLQNATNYFILSLSITDLLLGIFVLPFSIVTTLSPTWPLGGIFCNIYISTDVMLCTVSILTLFAISIDRYISVTRPLRYDEKMTGKVVLRVMIIVWVFSFLMAFIPIHVGINTPTLERQNMQPGTTTCIFELNRAYALLVALPTYFAPLIIMCLVYAKILGITRHQVREINKLTMVSCTNGNLTPEQKSRQVSDSKATRTLALIVAAFAVCWIPYFVLFTIKPFGVKINFHADMVCLWLGYMNSMLNPFVYAFYNSTYREAFKKILCRSCIDPQKKYNALLKGYNGAAASHRNGSAVSESSELANMKKNSTIITFMSEHHNS